MIGRPHRRGLLLATSLVALTCSATAVAFWSGAGSGSTQTRLGDPQPLVLSEGSLSAQLTPGGDANVAVVASNPNPYVVHVQTLVLDTDAGTSGFDVDGDHAACGVSSLSFSEQSNETTGWSVPPKTGSTDGSRSIDMDDALTMALDAPDACQGAVFTIHLVADH